MTSVENIKFDKLLAEKRHTELLRVLEKLAVSLSEAPEINIETNQDKVSEAMKKLSSSISEAITELKKEIVISKKQSKWEFEVTERDSDGYIKIVIVNPI